MFEVALSGQSQQAGNPKNLESSQAGEVRQIIFIKEITRHMMTTRKLE